MPRPVEGLADEPVGELRDGLLDELDELIGALANALAGLHAAGFRQRDLKAPNFLVRREGDGHLAVVWLDLDGIARPGAVSRRVRTRDLARLCTSFESSAARAAGVRASDWTRFVEAYLRAAFGPGAPRAAGAARSAGDEDWSTRAVERAVAATRRWAARHRARNDARGRPTA